MNQKLTEQIAYHILANLRIFSTQFVDQEQTKSVMDKQFLLSEKVVLETVEGDIIHKNVYGCQMLVAGSKELKLILVDCAQEHDLPEYCLFTQLKDAPAFGIYLSLNKIAQEVVISDALITVNIDKKHWMPCSTYLQATFLAGMEQIRDLGFGWTKCTTYHEQYAQLLSLIRFYDNYFAEDVADEE